MSKSTEQIRVAANGSVHVMPTGTTAPVSVSAAIPSGAVELGYTTDDGVTFSDGKTVENINVWQLFYAARQIVTGKESSVSFELVQWNAHTLTLAFGGGSVTEDAVGEYRYTPPAAGTIDERMLIVEWVDGDYTYRLIVPRGSVIEDVETELTKSDSANLPITFGILGADGVAPWYIQTDDPIFNPAST